MWDAVVTAMVTELDADAQLAAVVRAERAEYGERTVPGLRWSVVFDSEQETLHHIMIQLDYWSRSREQAALIERRIRRVLNRDQFRTVGAVRLRSLYQDARDMGDPEPGVVHRSLDFRFTVVREQLQ
jgi:hypothetical protein